MLSVLYKKAVLYMWVQNPLEIPVTLYIFKSKVACWRPAILLKLASLTGNFKGFWAQIQNSLKFKKRFLKNTFFAEHFALIFLSFNSFTKVLRVFRFYFYMLLHSKCHALHAVSSHTEKDSPRNLCLYLTAKNKRMRTKA